MEFIITILVFIGIAFLAISDYLESKKNKRKGV